MERFYLDHAATTPCRPEVVEAMVPYLTEQYGNPNCMHFHGRDARRAVEEARKRIANCLGCTALEIIFTSGGSESNNLAVRGATFANAGRGRHLITTRIEHHSVLHSFRALEAAGFSVTYLNVDGNGHVTPEQVAAELREDTVLVSIMHANNEVGTIQPIAAISRAVKARCPAVLVHTDAVQTVGHVHTNVQELGVDLLTFTAHKFYGPKGVGGLFMRSGVQLEAQILGGGQERGLRSGTEPVSLIVGAARALEIACRELADEETYWSQVRNRIITGLLTEIEDSQLNGHPYERLPNNVNVSFLGVNGEDLVLRLDRVGFSTSTGSACTTSIIDPTHVLTAMGMHRSWALGSCRLTLGHGCHGLVPAELIRTIREVVAELRSTSYRPTQRRVALPSHRVDLMAHRELKSAVST